MKRSMYSLILSDDIVAAVDALAAQKGTSRSNYINQVLAKHVQCITPEQQMQRVFANLTHQMDEAFRIQEQGSNALLSILGSVQYKYRPTIRYRVELLRNMQQEEVGRLKISCRTQNQTLLDAMAQFFRFWVKLEQKYDANGACAQGLYQIESGCMTMALLRSGAATDEQLGEIVGNYIRMFHAVLQSYFAGIQQDISGTVLSRALEQQYAELREQLHDSA
ncbi:hypothetical protein [Ruminococcus sp. CAG:330]|uniref:hypothetical protein n=1 Tax=Ruminococcus sp. CAG:330 TaxID=1262954 RepID=UPI00033E401C|nr:hypothetical protein [Ruminococcus sp. CAG:330]CDE12853.1 putative uncharacterized protein [Ruminococcus sp. CAG:330]